VAGLSALHTGSTDGVQTKPRVGFGLHFQDLYADGALGQISLGYAHDLLWQRDIPADSAQPDGAKAHENNFDRWVVDGLLFLPDVKLGNFQIAARLTADTPINRRGPSDVRASVLLYYDLNKWLENTFDSRAKSRN